MSARGHVRLQDVSSIFLEVELCDKPEKTDTSEEEPTMSKNSLNPNVLNARSKSSEDKWNTFEPRTAPFWA
jgi:hypothetical protein